MLTLALTSFACEDFTWHGAGADGDMDLEAEWVADSFVECTENQLDCNGTWKTVCKEGEWVQITDCSDFDKICSEGKCVWPSDGDASDGDAPDGDSLDGDNVPDGDASDGDAPDGDSLDGDNVPDGDASDGDAPDGDSLDGDTADGDEVTSYLSCTDGVCTDPATGFQWQQTPTGGTMTWDSAITHCDDLTLDGGGWRLPNISELRSLVRNCGPIETGGACGVKDVCTPCGDATVCLASSCYTSANCNPSSCADNGGPTGCYWPQQLSGTCSWFWSSSTYVYGTYYAWYVHFYGGSVYFSYKTDTSYARCVREGP